MRKFKIGDRVRWKGHTGTIMWVRGEKTKTLWDKDSSFDGKTTYHDRNLSNNFTKIGESKMSKYQELKSRIEALDNGWDKEADDMLEEIGTRFPGGLNPYFKIGTTRGRGKIFITDMSNKEHTEFCYTNQCEKNQVFKNALLWLLDHSDIKKDLVGTEQKVEIEGKVYKAKILGRE